MKKQKTFLGAVSLLLICAIGLCTVGCGMTVRAADLMEGIQAQDLGAVPAVSADSAASAADFAIRLFRECSGNGENTLLSPLSVLAALAMTANGAQGETLSQMESVLGMRQQELNLFFRSYLDALSDSEKARLSLADSIWFKSDGSFSVDRAFLQTNADYYGADAFEAPFDDSTLKEINSWVKRKTNGMIPEILHEIPAEAVMYLINALAFEAEWEEEYKEDQVSDGLFTREDGTVEAAEMMYSTVGSYLEDSDAVGFLKEYSGGRFVFAALLPNEWTSVSDYVASLDGEKLISLLSNPSQEPVRTAIPKFETRSEAELSVVLERMGMTDAFDGAKADFTGLGSSPEGNIRISKVIHKTFISVTEKGTKAGAATAVEMVLESAMEESPRPKEVILDRPFLYMLIDTETCVPFFIGTMMGVGG